jgi:uncharacterized damage-inducible protein DinB
MDAITLLVAQLDQAYDRKSWHGTNLRGSLRGLTLGKAAWRPAPGRHNIWEIAVHAAYWKYAVRRRLAGGTRGSFPLTGSNWFERSGGAGEKAWQADLRLLQETHRALREAVAALTPAALMEMPPGSTVSTQSLVSGIIAHDLYHAGQIQLIKRLQRR